ncbi:MAG: acyl-CoA/acyl-ACP dehydrogenase [Acidimicrobiia bacterium]|nr:acyl-CoA/acyl-ACP dehydrogenase [Acidimicrobiia bacterium]
MDLRLTDEQAMLRDAVRDALAEKSGPEVVRRMEDDPVGYPPELWKAFVDMDLVGLALPEEFGGSGQTLLEVAVLYEELGRALAPTPHFVSAVMAGGLLARAGNDEQKKAWLPAIARGETVLTTAWLEPGGSSGPLGVQLSARVEGNGYRLSGTKTCVPFARAAKGLLTLVRTGDEERAVDLLLVDPASPGVTLIQLLTMGGEAQYEVQLDDVAVPSSARIGDPGSGWDQWELVLEAGWVALAAWDVGCAARALEMATEYAAERVQFGRPIGSFQAVAHQLSTAAIQVEGARTLVHEAAWSQSVGLPSRQLAAMAKSFSGATARLATATGQQVLGGIGFTEDIDMHLYYRRAKQSQVSWCDPRYLEEVIASSILD